MSSTTARPRGSVGTSGPAGSVTTRTAPWLARLESPVTTYYLILSTMFALVVFGLVMVLSASMVTSLKDGGSAFSDFTAQAAYAVLGLIGAGVASRISVAWYRRLAVPGLVAAMLLQAMTLLPGIGVDVNGNRNWIRLGPVQLQPSEFAKIGLVLMAALILTKKRRSLGSLTHVLVPFVVPVAAGVIGLVLLGHDLGTALVLLAIVAAVLFVAGVPLRFFVGAGVVAAVGVLGLVLTSSNRMTRIGSWLGCGTDTTDACYQSVHGLYALADGGWWGVGLGASMEKWGWLPEAHNDFIFAIIGEELGLPGTLVILMLFTLLAFACYRLVVRSRDQFVRIASAGVMAWLLIQAMINIGSVIGLLPVIGIPLPLVSAGGSALVTTLLALGMLLSFARSEPGAREMLSARPHVVRRSLAVLPSRRRR
ncbi:MAG: putative lipid II flippase FtsW [Lapillicoccus sp.]